MAETKRSAEGTWHGTLREGSGVLTTTSHVLKDTPYTFKTRFEDPSIGTNPEELLMAAHSGCFSMALANMLSRKGHNVHHVHTVATCFFKQVDGGGFAIDRIHLAVNAKVDGLGNDEFQAAATETKNTCIVSQALKALPMTVEATLE